MNANAELQKNKKKRISFPSTASLLMIIILLCAICTYIIPAGEYERIFDEVTNRTIVVADSYKRVEQSPVGLWAMMASIYNGIIEGSEIIAFLFVIGGAFAIVMKSGAINAALAKLIKRSSGKEHIFIIVVMAAFALGGATFGMSEEAIPFVAILSAATIALGYDRVVGVAIVFVGVFCGFATGPVNPFSTGIAHKIVELPLYSGLGLRTVFMLGGFVIACHHTISYAKKVKQNPEKSVVADLPYTMAGDTMIDDNLTKEHVIILFILLATIVTLVIGIIKYEWYFAEISGLFFLMAIIIGFIIFKGDFNKVTDEFLDGAKSMAGAAMLVGLSRGVMVMLQEGMVMDTIVYAISLSLGKLNSVFAAWGMYLAQGLINFILPSTTGQAVVVMPIMGPVADVLGITRQVAVTAFQCGDGYWNFITPTHAELMACLGIAGVPFQRWIKFSASLVLKLSIWVCIMLAVAVMINWGPF